MMTRGGPSDSLACTPEGCCPELGELLEPDFFRALAAPSRIALVARLAELGRPSTVSEIAACCPVDLSVVSRHLKVLRRAGILEAARSGREVHYSIRHAALAGWLRLLAESVEACCPSPRPGRGESNPSNPGGPAGPPSNQERTDANE